jgi:hypothetical protein
MNDSKRREDGNREKKKVEVGVDGTPMRVEATESQARKLRRSVTYG